MKGRAGPLYASVLRDAVPRPVDYNVAVWKGRKGGGVHTKEAGKGEVREKGGGGGVAGFRRDQGGRVGGGNDGQVLRRIHMWVCDFCQKRSFTDRRRCFGCGLNKPAKCELAEEWWNNTVLGGGGDGRRRGGTGEERSGAGKGGLLERGSVGGKGGAGDGGRWNDGLGAWKGGKTTGLRFEGKGRGADAAPEIEWDRSLGKGWIRLEPGQKWADADDAHVQDEEEETDGQKGWQAYRRGKKKRLGRAMRLARSYATRSRRRKEPGHQGGGCRDTTKVANTKEMVRARGGGRREARKGTMGRSDVQSGRYKEQGGVRARSKDMRERWRKKRTAPKMKKMKEQVRRR